MATGDDKKDPKKILPAESEDDWLAAIDEWGSGLSGILEEATSAPTTEATVKTPAPKPAVFYRPPTEPIAPVIRERPAATAATDLDKTQVARPLTQDERDKLRRSDPPSSGFPQDLIPTKVGPRTAVPDAASPPSAAPGPVRPTRAPSPVPPRPKFLAEPPATLPGQGPTPRPFGPHPRRGGPPKPSAPPPRPSTGARKAVPEPGRGSTTPRTEPPRAEPSILTFDEPETALFGEPQAAPPHDTLESVPEASPTVISLAPQGGQAAALHDDEEPSVTVLEGAAAAEIESIIAAEDDADRDGLNLEETWAAEPTSPAVILEGDLDEDEPGAAPRPPERARTEIPFGATPDRAHDYWTARAAILEAQIAKAPDDDAAARILCEAARIFEQKLASPDRAVEALELARARAPRSLTPISALIRLSEEEGRWQDVERLVDEALEVELTADERLALLAYRAEIALSVRRDAVRAAESVAAARKLAPRDPHVALLAAEIAFTDGREDELCDRLAALEAGPGGVAALVLLLRGSALERKGDPAGALREYRAAIEREPSLGGAQIAVERTALASGDTQAAEEAASRLAAALGDAPEAAAIRYRGLRLATLASRSSPSEAASRLCELPATRARLAAVVAAARQAGDHEAMIRAATALADLSDGSEKAALWEVAASSLASSGRVDEAAESLARAATADPEFGPAIFAEEEHLRRTGQIQRAAERHAMFGEEHEAVALFEARGMSADALSLLDRVGAGPVARALAEALEIDRGGWAKVSMRRAEAVREDSDLGDLAGMLHALAFCQLAHLGDAEGATATLERVRLLAPDDPSSASAPWVAPPRRLPGTAGEAALAHAEATRSPEDGRAASAFVREGWALEAAGDAEGAARAYEAALSRAPGQPLAAAALCRLAWSAPMDPEGAAALARAAAGLGGGRAVHDRILAARAVADLDPAAALGDLQAAIAARGQSVDRALFDLAVELSPPGPARAELLEQAARGLDGTAAPARVLASLTRAAEAWADLGEPARAVQLYGRAEALAPDEWGVADALERALADEGNLDALAERCRADLTRDDPRTKLLAADRLQFVLGALRGDDEGAVSALDRLAEIKPDHLPTLRALERRHLAASRTGALGAVYARMADALAGGPGPQAPGPSASDSPVGSCADASAYCRAAARLADLTDGAPPFGSVELAVMAAEGGGGWALRYLEAHARLERDQLAFAEVCKRLGASASRPQEKAAYLTREGTARLALGDVRAAALALEGATAAVPDHLVALRLLAQATTELAIDEQAARAHEAAARSSQVRAHVAEDAYLAGRRYQDLVRDPARALEALGIVLEVDPAYLDAYDRAVGLLRAEGRHSDVIGACQRRIAAGGPPELLGRLWLELAGARLATADRAGAKDALRESCRVGGDQPDALRRLAELLVEDGEHLDATSTLIRLGKITADRDELRRIFCRLGEIYEDKLPDAKRAEASYRKALELEEHDLEILERLSRLYIRQGDWVQAREVTAKLVQLAPDAQRKREHRAALSRIFEEGLHDGRSAEAQLEEARREAPTDALTISSLYEFYKRQGAGPALAIHLDRAAADVRRVLAASPFDDVAYHTLFQTMGWRGSPAGARAVAEILVVLGKQTTEERAAISSTQAPGEKTADPALDELLAPSAIVPALREMLRLLSETFAKAYPVDLRSFGVTRSDRLSSKGHPIRETAHQMARWFGLGDIDIYISPRDVGAAVVLPGSPPALVLGRDLFGATDDGERAFLLARALKLVQAHLAVPLLVDPAELGLMLAAVVKQFDTSFAPPGIDAPALDERAQKLTKLIPRKIRDPLMPFALECAGARALDPAAIQAGAIELADRAGLVVSGSIAASLGALRKLAGDFASVTTVGELEEHSVRQPTVTRLLEFAVSDAYFKLRESL
ncbi:MAG: hypothetical protein HYY06_32525 [Deltaproteobacteria bacterium]|nr:hypothetical protein [Deltaproteobacteria bacterium]